MRGYVLVFCSLLLSGCFSSIPDNGTSQTSTGIQCSKMSCYIDRASPDHDYMLRNYALHQLTNTTGMPYRPQVEGDWIVWEMSRSPALGGAGFDGVVIHDVATDGVWFLSNAGGALLKKGKVAFTQDYEENGMTHYRAAIWDTGSKASQPVSATLDGNVTVLGFDGTWLFVRSSGSAGKTTDGLWGIPLNVGTPILVRSDTDHGNPGSNEQVYDAQSDYALDGGIAFYMLTRNVTQAEGVVQIKSFNLETHEAKTPYTGNLPIVAVQPVLGMLGLEAGGSIYLYKPATKEIKKLQHTQADGTPSSDLDSAGLSVANGWLLYVGLYDESRGVWGIFGYHVSDGRTESLTPLHGELTMQQVASDGHRLVVQLVRLNTYFQKVGPDLYWTCPSWLQSC